MIDVKEIELEQRIFNASWFMLKKYYSMSGSDVDYAELVSESKKIAMIGEGTHCQQLAIEISLSVIVHIERVVKSRKAVNYG